jgi:hypothetical protein
VFRRLFARLDPDVLDAVIGAWMWTVTRLVAGRRVIAIDGKTVRGARAGTAAAPHLVAAFDHAAGVVLGQVAVAAKTNELIGRCAAPGTAENWSVAGEVDAEGSWCG